MGFDFSKLSVLVVEDTLPMQKLIVTILKSLGVGRVVSACDGDEGFRLNCLKKPDIVITDWHMGNVSGIEMVSNIRGSASSPNKMVPIIMITGYSAVPKVEKARDVGVTEFLVKPFTAGDLARRIAYVINNPRDFVEAPEFFGPDRRRRHEKNYRGDLKRESDKSNS